MLGHRGSRSQAPVSLSDRIDALERHLHTLYAQRAGMMEPGEDWGWCASCGRNTVFPSEGEDTCRACLAEPPPTAREAAMTAAAIPAGRGLDAPDDCRRCAPAQGADRAPDPQGAPMPQQTTQLGNRTALALNIPIDDAREQQLDALWAMSSTERVAAMWRGDLTLYQLSRWSSRAQHEVPLLGGEFAWIVMRTPEWAEAADDLSDNVIYLTERQDDRAAA